MPTKSELLEAFDAVREMALNAQSVYERVMIGSFPPNDSLVMVISAGGETTPTLDRHGDLALDIVCNAKHVNQATVIDTLASIHRTLTSAKDLPSGEGWQILDITSSSLPTFIEYDGDQWLYGSGFSVKLWIM